MTATLSKWAERAAAAEANRQAMPVTAKFVDEMRRVFGDQCRVVWAEEAGRVQGSPGPRGVVAVVAFVAKGKGKR